jgi:hypothetical protein
MVDYTRMAATALRLIKANGHQIAVNKLGTAPADPTKPWRGPADNNNPLTDSQTLWAVDAGLEAREVGKVTTKKDIPDTDANYYLVAVTPTTPLLDDYDQVVDGGKTYAIVQMTMIKPGNTVLLYEIKVEK